MALYRYFRTVDVLPAPNGSLSTSVSPVTGRRGVVNYHSIGLTQKLKLRTKNYRHFHENLHLQKISHYTVASRLVLGLPFCVTYMYITLNLICRYATLNTLAIVSHD